MNTIIIEVSARHCHLSRAHVDILFGKDYELHVLKMISQPKQFAATETVTLETKTSNLKMRVIGPIRDKTQVEISASDARLLGIGAPIRLSGDTAHSAEGKLIGPAG